MHIEGGLLNCQSVFKNDIYMTSTRLDENNNERNLPNGTDKGSGKKDTKRSILKRSFKPAAKLDKKISKPPTSQSLPWVEEREDGAIFKTNLKRVRYRSSATDFSVNEEHACKQWETIKVKQIKAGQIRRLIEHLASIEAEEGDPLFVEAFLCTFRSFAKPLEVVNLLLERYMEYDRNAESLKGRENAGKRRVCSVISNWIKQYSQDFDEPPSYEALQNLIKFAEEHSYFPAWKDLLERLRLKLTTYSVSPFSQEEPFKFKFCSCDKILGCSCKKKTTLTKYERILCRDNTAITDINSFESQTIAEQLTLVDSELFLRAIPRQCLGCFWSRRDRGDDAVTVRRTVDQFNNVSNRVVSTILDAIDINTMVSNEAVRAHLIEKWIDIAQECRDLKNFSSLKAILAGLQSAAIFRLKRSWQLISRDASDLYDELSVIFSDDSNNKASRDLLILEGTGKYSTIDKGKMKKKSMLKRQSWMREGVMHGTVPYLGTFLTDLMMIDTAFPDKIEDGMINFEKKRKEFEIVVQIKLLQGAAKTYSIKPSEKFFQWFNSLKVYGDKDGYAKSMEVEPKKPVISSSPQLSRKSPILRRHKSESCLNADDDVLSRSVSLLSLDKIGLSRSISGSNTREKQRTRLPSRTSLSPEPEVTLNEEGVIIRVYLTGTEDVMYKSIKMTPSHKACDVINMTLIKFKSLDEAPDYSIFQILPNKKTLHIPFNSNMYYAVRKGENMRFKVSKHKSRKRFGTLGSFTSSMSGGIAGEVASIAGISLTSFTGLSENTRL